VKGRAEGESGNWRRGWGEGDGGARRERGNERGERERASEGKGRGKKGRKERTAGRGEGEGGTKAERHSSASLHYPRSGTYRFCPRAYGRISQLVSSSSGRCLSTSLEAACLRYNSIIKKEDALEFFSPHHRFFP
jgi:hypothetical protein